MKKFLSLVLALVMTMSLVTISAGAKDFTDSDDVNYDAAIEVMSELKVIDGYTDGSFRPTVELNRGAAAKIICNMILGPTTASALSASSAPFSDVPADSVFAGYITYCSKEGIINGYTDGTFRPTAPLTGYAFMKMLLGALGYDSDIEGYTGANWSVNVAKQAIGIGLDDGNDNFVGTKYVTREEACQYALNTLKATMVEYDSKTTVTVNGAQVVVGGSNANEVSQNGYANTMNESFLQFAEKYFPNLKVTPAEDDFARPADKWTIKNKTVGTFAEEPTVTYTESVAGKTIYADLGSDSADAEWDAYENGLDVTSDIEETTFAIAKKNDDDKIGAQGTLTEVYYDSDAGDDGEIRIVMIQTFVATVDGDYDEDDEVLELAELDVDGLEALPEVDLTLSSDDFDGLENFADEDIVLVTVACDEAGDQYIASIQLAEKVTAVIDEHVLDESVTADGTEYKFAWAWATVDNTENYVVDEEYDLYLDVYGNIIYSEGVDEEDVYAFVVEFAPTSFMNLNSKVDAYTYFVDGSEDEVRVAKVNSKKVKAVNIDETVVEGQDFKLSEVENNWFTYTEDEGVYNLTLKAQVETETSFAAATEQAPATMITEEDSIKIFYEDAKYARGTKNTQFIVVDADGDVSVYTGIKNAPELTAGENTKVYVVVDDNNYAEYVFVSLADGASDGTADSDDVIFFIDAEKEGTDAADNDYYRFKAIVNGETGKVRTDVDVSGVSYADLVIGLYAEIEYDSETGYVTEAALVEDGDDYVVIDADGAEISQKNGVITFNELTGEDESEDQRKVYMTDDASIYVIDGDGNVKTVTAKKLASSYSEAATMQVYGVLNDDAECTALYIYAVK